MTLFAKPIAAIRLAISFLLELVKSNLAVVRIVMHPRLPIRPGIIAYRTTLRTQIGLATLANLITLTPGTLTLDVDQEAGLLFIHTIAIDNPQSVCDSIRAAFEVHIAVLES
ncbi:MAG: multicomponent Na+:H+ antiporter subunit E [Hyphomicrobiaceae bacterium]|jgi:multicomponent Na+:H+ antiporter subunit E